MRGVEMEKHADEEEEQERHAVEKKDVRDVGDIFVGEEGHLFFGCGHEDYARGVKELLTMISHDLGYCKQCL